MLHDHAGRERELAQQQARGGEVEQVDQRQVLPMELLDAREEVHACALFRVVRRALMRVLAVPQVGDLREGERKRVGQPCHVEPARDRRLVRGGRRERLRGEGAARVERDLTGFLQLVEDGRVASGPADGRAVSEVLRRAAQHRRAADVDHLHRFLFPDAVPPCDLAERIEVDAHEVERPDLVLVERREVVVLVAPREDRRVDGRVERLDAPAEHLRDAGQLLDSLDVQTDLALEKVGGPSAGHELEAGVGEAAGEVLQPRLVVTGDQRAAHSSLTTAGRIRCSTACTRRRSVSTSSSG